MAGFFRSRWKSWLLRPLIYRTVSRLLAACAAAAFWVRYGTRYSEGNPLLYVCSGFTIIFAGLAWFSFLRLDGVNLPRFRKRKKDNSEPKHRLHGGLTDDLDTEPVSFEELTDEEQDFVTFLSRLICTMVTLGPAIISLIS